MTYANTEKPKFLEFITPVGRLVHCYHDQAQVEIEENSKKPKLDEDGIPLAYFKTTVMWPRAELDTTLIPFRTLAAQARDLKWPTAATDQWFRLQTLLRDGDNPEHNTSKKDYLFGQVYMNFKAKAKPQRLADGKVIYTGAPGLIGPYNEDILPVDVYSGCMARVSGIMFGTEYSGKNFISVRLNNIQKAADGERLGGGGRPDARSQFDPLASGPAPGAANPFAGAGLGVAAPGGLPSVI